jgi:uncharacterized cupin superfamily protein
MSSNSIGNVLVTLQTGENKGNPFSHSEHEFLYILEGILTVMAEQSLMFDASKVHYWYNFSNQSVQF